MLFSKPLELPTAATALPGRDLPIPTAKQHFVTDRALKPPYPDGFEVIDFGMGCFWGAERVFWQMDGVWVTAVGYGGGITPNPTYEEVCSGRTGHTELVRVVFDPERVALPELLRTFWEAHDPTQGMRQGNDRGTQYRSAIYVTRPENLAVATQSREAYQGALEAAGRGATITTEIEQDVAFYFAEDYHQQYLAKNPGGYCGIGGTGVSCPMPASS
jgi:peptide-methionine (S)-S-oxide reductase